VSNHFLKERLMKVIFAAVFSLFSSITFAAESNVYKNPTAGFSVTKPSEWHYVTAEQNLNNLKATKLNDNEFQAAMVKYATAPMVAMTKHEEPYSDVNPSFKVNIKPLGQFKGKDPKEIIGVMIPQLQKIFKDFKLVQPPTTVMVSGFSSAYARINYTMEVVEIGELPISSELWIIPRGDYFFLLGAGTRQDEKTGSRKEIESIINTIVIAR
jgi:hypothetical protein